MVPNYVHDPYIHSPALLIYAVFWIAISVITGIAAIYLIVNNRSRWIQQRWSFFFICFGCILLAVDSCLDYKFHPSANQTYGYKAGPLAEAGLLFLIPGVWLLVRRNLQHWHQVEQAESRQQNQNYETSNNTWPPPPSA